jgi:UDPglucose 6-dehydrogenase
MEKSSSNIRVSVFGGGFVGKACYDTFNSDKLWDKFKVRLYDVNPERSLHSYEETVKECDVAFVAVPTPTDFELKVCDTSIVEKVVAGIRENNKDCEIVIKSTVPPGTTEKLAKLHGKVFFNPEFLTAKNALEDFQKIEYQLLGVASTEQNEALFQNVVTLFRALSEEQVWNTANIIVGDASHLELVKYARNAYLATRLSFFQELRNICESLGCDSEFVKGLVCLDPRIGQGYSEFKGKWGGLCLPKDLNVLIGIALSHGVEPVLLEGVWERNCLTPGVEDWLEIPGAVVVPTVKP